MAWQVAVHDTRHDQRIAGKTKTETDETKRFVPL